MSKQPETTLARAQYSTQPVGQTTSRTIDDVLADHRVRVAGRTRYEGQPPRDDEIMVAEIERLREVVARAAFAKGDPIAGIAAITLEDQLNQLAKIGERTDAK